MPTSIKTTVQLKPDVYERMCGLVARRRSLGERVDNSTVVNEALEERLRGVVLSVRSVREAPTESAA